MKIGSLWILKSKCKCHFCAENANKIFKVTKVDDYIYKFVRLVNGIEDNSKVLREGKEDYMNFFIPYIENTDEEIL